MNRQNNFNNIASTITKENGYNKDHNFIFILTAKNFYTKNITERIATAPTYEKANELLKELQKRFENELKTNDFVLSFLCSQSLNTINNNFKFAKQ